MDHFSKEIFYVLLAAISIHRCYCQSDTNYRLPKNILPTEYTLKITPYLNTSDGKNFTFIGDVKIKFINTKPDADNLTLHSRDLRDMEFYLDSSNITITSIAFNYKYDFVTLYLSEALKVDLKYSLTVKYSGNIRDNLSGFYRSSYRDDGITKWLATTQFQPDGARSMFPCFDEPGFKAKFNIIIDCPTSYNCLSNMPIKDNVSNGTLLTFEQTPMMSTYLVAIVVADFTPSHVTENGRFSIMSRYRNTTMGLYAFNTGQELVNRMGDYTNVSYFDMDPSIKMDHAAVPDLWVAGMENWGLYTYRDIYLLYDPEETPVRYKQRVATVMSHEIVHSWFGNYATCHWWSDTWLNEGFTRYFEYFHTNRVEDFGLEDQFVITQVQDSLLVDTSNSSKPLSDPGVNSPSEILQHFATLSYSKGACVSRMVYHWIEESALRDGLRRYFAENPFGNTQPNDMYSALQYHADVEQTIVEYNTTVEQMMGSWLTKAGYPLLSVTINRDDGVMELKQKRFLNIQHNEDTLYMIPVTFTTEQDSNFNSTKPLFIMKERTYELQLDIGHEWIVFNIQQTGFYRIDYDDMSWNLIINVLNSENRTVIHRFNRAQIVDDAFNLAREGHMNYSKMFDIVEFLKNETEYAPWTAAFSGFSFLRKRLISFSAVLNKLNNHLRSMMDKVIRDLTLEEDVTDDNLRMFFRSNILSLVCELGHVECIDDSLRLFELFKNNGTKIKPNLREHVYCNALRNGTSENFDYLWENFDEDIPSEVVLMINAFGCSGFEDKLNLFLSETTKSNSAIRKHDQMLAFNSALSGRPEHVQLIYEFVTNNIKEVKLSYGSNINAVFSNMAQRMTPSQLSQFEEFLRTSPDLTMNEINSGLSAIATAFDDINWTSSVKDEIENWLDKNSS